MYLLQEIYKDRKKFSKAVFEVASSDLVNMGVSVVSYTLKDIRDDEVTYFVFWQSSVPLIWFFYMIVAGLLSCTGPK